MASRIQAYEVALQIVVSLQPAVEGLARRDRDLADQMRRAAASVVLNLAEGARRIGRDRMHFYRIAAGSTAEVQAALEVAQAWGYLGSEAAAEAVTLIDRVLAMLWRLTHGTRGAS